MKRKCSTDRAWTVLVPLVISASIGCDGAAPPDPPAAVVERAAGDSPAERSSDAEPEPAPSILGEAELRDGWIALFDGETLFGWQATSDANWHVDDGSIVVDSGEKGLLCTTSQFSDYVLQLDFRCDPATNSGIFLRTQLDPGDVATQCYELNIAPADNPFPTGSLVQRAKVDKDVHRDDWQTYEVTVLGDQVSVALDGDQLLEYRDSDPLGRGRIGLQLNEGRVAFRSIKLKPLGMEPIFNGLDLTGWTSYPDQVSEFAVSDDGWLNVKNGPGQLETEEVYGDFVLQLESRVNAAGLNSGIFFRSIPGDQMMGYESQIHNGFKNNRRSEPVDWGTGAIFRRQKARVVMADDLTWFHKTLIADGAHMAVWVNGYQVSDWVDTREANENPRRGKRLAPGSIIIQGHDETTDLSFRNLRIDEMTPRHK